VYLALINAVSVQLSIQFRKIKNDFQMTDHANSLLHNELRILIIRITNIIYWKYDTGYYFFLWKTSGK